MPITTLAELAALRRRMQDDRSGVSDEEVAEALNFVRSHRIAAVGRPKEKKEKAPKMDLMAVLQLMKEGVQKP